MDDIPIHNHSPMPLWVGGTMVPPGETRIFPMHQVPEHLRPAPVAAEPEAVVDLVLALLDGSVADVAEGLGDLLDESLDRLESAEKAGKARKGVMSAIAEERLRRANAAQIREQLAQMDDAALEKLYNDLPDGAVEGPIAEALMVERGIGVPAMRARLLPLDDAALYARRAELTEHDGPDSDDELAEVQFIDEMLAARAAALGA
ncbi:MAG: hypothetical protein AB7U92_25735 [Piscinibacter sp.]|uniref:hypothetical protein n=1 Tax=Piscinibacter sp. TaxID=1903157 RepID=UPI003D129150